MIAVRTALSLASLRLVTRSYEGNVREAAEALKLFSPQVAMAAARFQRLQLLLQVQRAQAVGGSTAALLEARGQLAQAQQPFGIEFQNLRNLINTAGTRLQTGLIQFIDSLGLDDAMKKTNEILSKLLGIELDNQGGGMQHALRDFLRSTAQGRFPRSPTPAEMAAGGLERPRGR